MRKRGMERQKRGIGRTIEKEGERARRREGERKRGRRKYLHS